MGEKLQVGDRIDYYIVDALEPNQLLLLHSQLRAPGAGWMEWRVVQREASHAFPFTLPPAGTMRALRGDLVSVTCLVQNAYFAPRGLPGFLYWILLYPFHAYVLHGLIRAIARRAVRA